MHILNRIRHYYIPLLEASLMVVMLRPKHVAGIR